MTRNYYSTFFFHSLCMRTLDSGSTYTTSILDNHRLSYNGFVRKHQTSNEGLDQTYLVDRPNARVGG